MKKTFTLSRNDEVIGTFRSFRAACDAAGRFTKNGIVGWTTPWTPSKKIAVGQVYTLLSDDSVRLVVS
jgi:hypothetical protein